jgi:sulfite exporter TauE/SafE
MWQSLLAAFSLGFIGSVHCVGMCGPLVLALPVHHMNVSKRIGSIWLYHSGRITVYASGGLLFGLLGRRVYLAGWQQGLSILLGVSILCWLAFKGLRGQGGLPGWANRFYGILQGWLGRLWQSPSPGKFLLMGIGNGLLPCGMVYLAIAGALTTENILQGMGFMACFGLGTLPLLLGLQMTGRMVNISFRQKIRKALPYLTVFVAILLILRGLNLGIPWVSPALATRPGQVIECH